MNKDLLAIFEYLEREKGIKRSAIIDAISESLKVAARKSVKGLGEKVTVEIDPKTGEIEVFTQKQIVEQVDNPAEEISLEEAKTFEPECEVGQWLELAVPPQDFGRIAAVAARQIISQKIKGAEKEVIHEEYRHRVGELISGTVKRFIRGRTIVVDLGKVEAIMPERNYPKLERYNIGEKVHALLYEVRDTEDGRGAEVVLTRSHPEFVTALFTQEVPELHDKTVSIEAIARDAGYRTKLAVLSYDPKVDPVGTCVGVRGTRIKNVIRELNNEKIDVVPFTEDPVQLLKNLMAPIEPKLIREYEDHLWIVVNDEEYPLVIGKKGMNARLIGRMIGKEIKVHKLGDFQKLLVVQMKELHESTTEWLDEKLKIEGVSGLVNESLIGAGFDTYRKLTDADPVDLMTKVPGVNYYDLADKLLEQIGNREE